MGWGEGAASMQAAAAARTAEALVRALGGSEARLRIVQAELAEGARGLGMEVMAAQEITISPVALRTLGESGGVEALIPATILEQAGRPMGIEGEALLRSAAYLACGERMLRIVAIQAESFAGVAYLFRARVEE